jgi:lipopolysaccharide transport system permease protein
VTFVSFVFEKVFPLKTVEPFFVHNRKIMSETKPMPTSEPMFIIKPVQGFGLPDFRELLDYRELLYYFVWRDLKVRFKQTAIGIGWAIIPPVFNMVVFSVIFGSLAKLPSEGVPYTVFSFVGLTAWGLFAKALSGASNSLLTGAGLSAKVYFPRIMVTLSAILSSLVDFAIALVLMFILLLAFGIHPGWAVFTLPLFSLLGLLTAMAAGLWLSALTVQYRDVAQGVGLLTTMWMYASPVAYSPTLLPAGILGTLYWLNPMAVVVQGFRWALLGSSLPPILPMVISVVMVLVMLVTGFIYFHRAEKTFIDLV